MFLLNGMSFICFSFIAVLLPFNILWAIVYGVSSSGGLVLAGLTVKYYKELEIREPPPPDPRET